MSENPECRAIAIAALGEKMLTEPSVQVRLRIIESLTNIRDESAILYLIKAFDDPNPEIRGKVAEAIGEILRPMTEAPKSQNITIHGPVGNVNASDVTVQGDQVGIQQNESSDPKIVEITTEIQKILDQLAQTEPASTEAEKQALVVKAIQKIKNQPTLKARLWSAVKAGGIEAVKAIANHPSVSIPIEVVKGWIEAESD